MVQGGWMTHDGVPRMCVPVASCERGTTLPTRPACAKGGSVGALSRSDRRRRYISGVIALSMNYMVQYFPWYSRSLKEIRFFDSSYRTVPYLLLDYRNRTYDTVLYCASCTSSTVRTVVRLSCKCRLFFGIKFDRTGEMERAEQRDSDCARRRSPPMSS